MLDEAGSVLELGPPGGFDVLYQGTVRAPPAPANLPDTFYASLGLIKIGPCSWTLPAQESATSIISAEQALPVSREDQPQEADEPGAVPAAEPRAAQPAAAARCGACPVCQEWSRTLNTDFFF